MSVFRHYARYYDLLYRDKDYAAEAAYVSKLLGRYGDHAASILDIGCGTGLHALVIRHAIEGVRVGRVQVDRDALVGVEHEARGAPGRAAGAFDVLALACVLKLQVSRDHRRGLGSDPRLVAETVE